MLTGIEYSAYDGSTGLSIAAKVYDVTTGAPVLAATLALAHVINGTYFVTFSPANDKTYLINTMVYTDGTFATPDTNYAPASRTFDLDTRLANLDAAISTRLPTSSYRAPTNSVPKNTALGAFEFPMTDLAAHLPMTGLTVSVTRSIDGAAFVACANAAAEVANGIYKIDLAAADLNGGVVTLKFAATGADVRFATIVTEV